MFRKISNNDFTLRGGLRFAALLVLTLVVFTFCNAQSTPRHNRAAAINNVAASAANGQQSQPSLLIDSFKAGPTPLIPVQTAQTSTQKGDPQELLGGSRDLAWVIQNQDKQSVSFQVLTSKSALFVNQGYGVVTGLQIAYNVPPVSADLTKYDRFLIDFDGLDRGMHLAIVVYGHSKVNDGHTANNSCDVVAPKGPFTVSFPFTHLAPEVLAKAYKIVFELQTSNAGSDYAITRISSAKGAPSAKNIFTCFNK